MRKNQGIRALRKALKSPDLYSEEEYKYLLTGYYKQLVKKEMKKHATKQKGFGYVGQVSISDATSRADDGVYSEGEQSVEPGES